MTRKGFPHSEIPGSKLVCSSPRLIAAYRVLRRLLAPRHSPYALSSLTTSVLVSSAGTPPARGRTPSLPMNPLLHTACVQKRTTVCRIFSCQRACYLTAPGSLCKLGASGQPALAGSLTLVVLGRPSVAGRARPASRNPLMRQLRRRRLVENTGLEPVTSWLQTRRSPS